MPIIDNSDSLKFCIGFADSGQPQGLSLLTVGNKYFGNFVPLARQRCVGVAAPYKIRSNKIVRISRADGIRPTQLC